MALVGCTTLLDERTERFTITLSAANGGPLVDATAKVTIRDDDRAPRVTMGDMTVTEGDSGTSVGVIPVWLSNPSAHDVVVTYRTHSRSARAGKDYVRTRGTITIPAGSTGAFITIPIIGDHRHERTESFRVEVTGATNSVIRDGTATETILDND